MTRDDTDEAVQQSAAPTTDRARALVDDDDDAYRETLSLWLDEADGWTGEAAADGREALAKLDGSVDALVLDRHMPTLSGPEVVERLDETGFDGPVVVLSAFTPDDHLAEGDVDEYLTKPIDQDTLVETLERHR